MGGTAGQKSTQTACAKSDSVTHENHVSANVLTWSLCANFAIAQWLFVTWCYVPNNYCHTHWKQESCAIAKMTARCALYIGYSNPNFVHAYTSTTLRGFDSQRI